MILEKIVSVKLEEVAYLKKNGIRHPEIILPPHRGFREAIGNYKGVAVIAEAKKASPSKGIIRPRFDPVEIGRQYETAGAQALSVLTDKQFFQGDIAFIPQIRAAVGLPVLRKDFIIDELQIEEAKAFGSDAVLLIAAILDDHQLHDFRETAEGLHMDVLVEVHDEEELDRTVQSGARLIGINNRNLHDFTVSLETTFRLKHRIPSYIPVVSESGIRTHAEMARLAREGIQAVLVGETFMRAENPGEALKTLRYGPA